MKILQILILLPFLISCSFDNKTGIWKNEGTVEKDENEIIFKDFKKISSSNQTFNEIITINPAFNFIIEKSFQNRSWNDFFYGKNNNIKNLKYSNKNKLDFKSKKLTKHKINKYLLFENNNLILNDRKGNIIIYSIDKNSIISKFNFYKKQFRNLDKVLNLVVEKNIIYVSDNIGYIYAYNYKINRLIWAKNYKIPFRSNIKLSSNKIIISNQNNDLFIFEKTSGDIIKLIPSEETIINNSFVNNIALTDGEILFLNTYGSLYSIDKEKFNIDWFINLNKSLDLSLSNLFFGSKLVFYDKKILVSSNENFYIIDSKSGSIFDKKNFSTLLRPVINNKYIFLVTKNNLLIALDLKNGNIIYSYDISQKVADYIGTKKKSLNIKNLMLINNKIYVFLQNSHIIKFDLKGEIDEIIKLPYSFNSQPIIVNKSLF